MSTTFSVRGVPCSTTSFISVATASLVTLAPSYYALALAESSAFPPWGQTLNIIYAADGTYTSFTNSYWNVGNSLFLPAGTAFSRAAFASVVGSKIAFQFQLCQVLIFCPGPYNVPEFDWVANYWAAGYPAAPSVTPTSCSDGTVTYSLSGATVNIALPTDAGTLPSYSITQSWATWKLLNLAALCGA